MNRACFSKIITLHGQQQHASCIRSIKKNSFRMKTAKLLLSIVFLTFAQLSFAQQIRVVSGTLVGADKSPIPGVSISIKGTATGTVTDLNGNYSIKVPLGATLEY